MILAGAVPVYVEVDGDEVTRVTVDDAEFAYDMDLQRIRDLNDDQTLSLRQVMKAFEVAEKAEWPAWDWGA